MVKLFGNKLSRLQLTLCLIKPDVACIDYKTKCIQQIIIDNNFFIIRSKYKCLTVEDAKRFYSEHEGKFFHSRLISFITSGPLWAHILAHPDAIKTWRNLMGPTKVFKALYEAPDTIRGKFGLSDTRNAVHGSDSEETASREIDFFFPEFSQHNWRTHEEPHFQHPDHIHFDPDQRVHTFSKAIR